MGWFAPPVLSTPEGTRQAHTLWLASWPLLGVIVVLLGLAVAAQPETLARRAVTIGAVAALVAILHETSRRGQTVLAATLLVNGLTLIVTQRAWNTGGIHAPLPVFYALFIVMSGAILGRRASIATALLAFAGALFLTAAEVLGWLPPPAGARPPLASLTFVMLAIGMALVVPLFLLPDRRDADAVRSDWLQMLVHDMRSPLTVLLVRLGMIREEVSGSTAHAVETAMGDVRSLNELTNNVLDVSRLESGQFPLARERTDLVGVAQRVAAALGTLEPEREIRVSGVTAAPCNCDPDVIRRVLENLVANALKHTPSSSSVRIVVAAAPGIVRLSVRDDGPGIPDELRCRVFDRFTTGTHRLDNGHPSTGLGLAFCKLAVELHGGSIRVDKLEPRGTVFIVELPA